MATRRGVLMVGCALAVLAGCSSSPDVRAQAQVSRAAVLPEAKALPAQVTATGVAWPGGVGGYEDCGWNDPLATPANSTSLQHTAEELMAPLS